MQQDITQDPRFERLPKWAQTYATRTKTVKYTVFFLTTVVITVLIQLMYGWIINSLLVAIVTLVTILTMSFRFIPSNPLYAAIPTILETRLPITYRAGFTFVIPFLEKLLFIEVTDIDSDWTFEHVPARLESQLPEKTRDTSKAMAKVLGRTGKIKSPNFGGQLTVTIQYSLTPDYRNPWALIDILNKKGVDQALGFLQGIVGDDVRQAGRALTWQQYMFATDLVSIKLIADVTGVHTIKYPEDKEVDVFEEPTSENIRVFFERVQSNGISDIRGSGFRINTLSILSVDPEGKLAEEADRVVIEKLKRAQLGENMAALRENIETLKGPSPDGSITDEAALAALQAEDGKLEQKRSTIKLVDADKIASTVSGGVERAIIAFFEGKKS